MDVKSMRREASRTSTKFLNFVTSSPEKQCAMYLSKNAKVSMSSRFSGIAFTAFYTTMNRVRKRKLPVPSNTTNLGISFCNWSHGVYYLTLAKRART